MMGSGRSRFSGTPAEGDGRRPRPGWWRRIGGYLAAVGDAPVVHDRRLGERRRQLQGLVWERRRGERRGPPRHALHAVASHLGAGSKWQGELHFRGVLRIDGTVEGHASRRASHQRAPGSGRRRRRAESRANARRIRAGSGRASGERVIGTLWAPQ
jgi:hypothetical protein